MFDVRFDIDEVAVLVIEFSKDEETSWRRITTRLDKLLWCSVEGVVVQWCVLNYRLAPGTPFFIASF